jgi:hypothetical protein
MKVEKLRKAMYWIAFADQGGQQSSPFFSLITG